MERFLVLLAVVVALVAGCRPAPREVVELSWATNEHVTRRDAVAWFERENPGIRVRIRPISEPRQFFLQCLYGDAPDVITFFKTDAFQAFARNGQLCAMEAGEVTPWPYYDALGEYCFARNTGALMALPQVAYPYVLYFNKELVSVEKAMAVDTWADLLALARAVPPNGGKGGRKVFGLDIQNSAIWFTTWYWQRGGRFFAPDGTPCLDRQKAVATLDAMARWRQRPGVIPRPQDRLNLPSAGASQGVLGSLFLQGRAMFYWSGSWKICDFEAQHRVNWGVRPLPRGPVNAMTVMGGNSFGVSARSRHPREAERFVRYLASPRAQARHISHKIYLPAHKGVEIPARYTILKDQARVAHCPEYSPNINEALLKEIFTQALEAHRLGVVDSQTAVDLLSRSLGAGSLVIDHE